MKKTKTQREREKKKKKKTKPSRVKGKRKKKKKMKTSNPVKKKKRGSKVAADSNHVTHYIFLITEMPLKTELWKLKTTKTCFQFP